MPREAAEGTDAATQAEALTERPILFSAPLVRALLDGRKTVTRRIIRNPERFTNIRDSLHCCPFGQPGDQLWVRETWCLSQWSGSISNGNGELEDTGLRAIRYKADRRVIAKDPKGGRVPTSHGWKPGIHMFRWMSRIDLEVTAVRIERLHEIGASDVEREGIELNGCTNAREIRRLFIDAWNRINGGHPKKRWSANPWVWVVDFRTL